MKNISLATLAILLFAVLSVYSCKKDSDDDNNTVPAKLQKYIGTYYGTLTLTTFGYRVGVADTFHVTFRNDSSLYFSDGQICDNDSTNFYAVVMDSDSFVVPHQMVVSGTDTSYISATGTLDSTVLSFSGTNTVQGGSVPTSFVGHKQ